MDITNKKGIGCNDIGVRISENYSLNFQMLYEQLFKRTNEKANSEKRGVTMAEMKVALKGLTCANCAGKIEDTLSKLSETQEVSINLLRQEITVKLAPNASAEEMQETGERVVHKFEPEVEVAFLQGQKAEHHHAHHEHCGCGCEEDDDDDDCCACGCGCGHDHAHGDENVFGRKFFLRFGIGLAVFLAAVFLRERSARFFISAHI